MTTPDRPLRVLLTGFEPFDGEPVNPSERLVRSFAEDPHALPGVRVCTGILPVDHDRLPAEFAAARRRASPDLALLLGQGTGRASVDLERLAHNEVHRPPVGTARATEVLETGGPPCLASVLPLERCCEVLLQRGRPVRLSDHAGHRECNALYYTVLRQHPDLPAAFVHVPLLPEQVARRGRGEASLSSELTRTTLAELIQLLTGLLARPG